VRHTAFKIGLEPGPGIKRGTVLTETVVLMRAHLVAFRSSHLNHLPSITPPTDKTERDLCARWKTAHSRIAYIYIYFRIGDTGDGSRWSFDRVGKVEQVNATRKNRAGFLERAVGIFIFLTSQFPAICVCVVRFPFIVLFISVFLSLSLSVTSRVQRDGNLNRR